MDTIKIMRQFIFICIAALFSTKGAAQSLTDCTLSACSFQTDELTGLAGEASAVSLSSNATSLVARFHRSPIGSSGRRTANTSRRRTGKTGRRQPNGS